MEENKNEVVHIAERKNDDFQKTFELRVRCDRAADF